MNTPPAGFHTHREILSQPEAWTSALAVLREQATALLNFYLAGHYQAIYFTGCGSTYYLALAAAAAMQELTGLPARGLPASEIWLSPRSAYTVRRSLLIAVSRSGETTETRRACEAFRAGGGEVLTLSCYPGRGLTQLGHYNLVLPSGQEDSIAQTRAFTTLYLATLALAALWSDRADLFDALANLPAHGQAQISKAEDLARSLGLDLTLDRFYFLGSGLRYGLACEISLKMKEMTLSHSEPFHFLEFRHGPKSMVTAHTLIVGLVSNSNHAAELQVVEEMRALGARALTLGEAECEVAFQSGLPEILCGPLYLPLLQLMACERSLAKGLNPDRPHQLEAVVKLAHT